MLFICHREAELVMAAGGSRGADSVICIDIILHETYIGCLVYKELDMKSIYIIRCVTQGEKKIYCVQLC